VFDAFAAFDPPQDPRGFVVCASTWRKANSAATGFGQRPPLCISIVGATGKAMRLAVSHSKTGRDAEQAVVQAL